MHIMWTWGLIPTKFWQIRSPYSDQGLQIIPTEYACPHHVLKATAQRCVLPVFFLEDLLLWQ